MKNDKTQQEIQKCRERWSKAKEQGDEKMMILWEKMGKCLKSLLKKDSLF